MLRTYSNDDDKKDAVLTHRRSVDAWECGDDSKPRSRSIGRWNDDEELCRTPSYGRCTGVHNCFGEPKTVEKDICTHEFHTAPINEVLHALESSRDTYAQELMRLKAITGAFSPNEACDSDKVSPTRDFDMQTLSAFGDGPLQSTGCAALLEKLNEQKDNLQKELEEQRNNYANLQRQLEQEREEKLEAQSYINMMHETVTAALNGEKLLVEQHRHLLADQRILTAKFGSISKTKLTGLRERLDELESVHGCMEQREESLVLYNKLWIHGLSICLQIVLLCHALFVFLTRVLNADFIHGPT